MCGIAGVFGNHVGSDPLVTAGVRRMMDALRHRGPDDEGFLELPDSVLGHRRLSIVDLSSAGRQPMSNEDGTVWVSFNGEVYNHGQLRRDLQSLGHRFSSASDTEVLAHGYEAWGIEALLEKLRGMFAFALVDSRPTQAAHRLFLARDRLGIKPLYYSLLSGQRIAFASEVRALRESGLVAREDDPESFLAFLLFGSVPTPRTTVKSITTLPPGHYLAADSRGAQVMAYYSLSRLFLQNGSQGHGGVGSSQTTPPQGNRIRAALEEAVSLHLISDAPLGVFLSGGLDSSAIVALAARQKQDLRTIGVIFSEKEFSEERSQQIVARRFRTQHTTVYVTLEDFRHEVGPFLAGLDQPTVDGLNTYFVARAARDAGLKAVLSGLGGDEIFQGYSTLWRAPSLWRIRSLPGPLRQIVIAAATVCSPLKKLAFLKHSGLLDFYLVQRGLFTPREAAHLLGTEEREAWSLIRSLEPAAAPHNPVLIQQFLEARHYLVDQLLKDTDVFGMAHSIEVRVPYLDHMLVEAALKGPISTRLSENLYKPLLIDAVKDLLPAEILTRTKQGFTFPMADWLRASKGLFQEARGAANAIAYETIWKEFIGGSAHWSRPWALLVLDHARR